MTKEKTKEIIKFLKHDPFILDEERVEIEWGEKWLEQAGYCDNSSCIAFYGIKDILRKRG